MAVRLMRNICLWNKIIALPVLEKLALDDLLSRKVLPHLRSVQSNVYDAVTRIERVVTSLMGVWAGPSVAGQCRYRYYYSFFCMRPKLCMALLLANASWYNLCMF